MKPSHTQLVAAARAIYENDDVEIDDNATLSRSCDGGSWVQAWVWVSDDEAKQRGNKK